MRKTHLFSARCPFLAPLLTSTLDEFCVAHSHIHIHVLVTVTTGRARPLGALPTLSRAQVQLFLCAPVPLSPNPYLSLQYLLVRNSAPFCTEDLSKATIAQSRQLDEL